ncbi:hypothetical protein Taro_031200 [Colocasia esculenta]|uniref:Uncharacterized protein n=1 Tax=Colocasia esculenta TaxID=4460 RepID=A0A843W2G4_COLES|nr:hypothetical protein [Colocasia esculenta]
MVAEILLQPWLREVGVAERRPVRTSRDVTSGRSNRPRHRKALYFPHRRLWITEYSCKVWCKPCRPNLIPRKHFRHSWRLRILDGCFFLLKMKDYDAILGLDWLEEHYALVDCVVGDVAPLEETVETDSERGD